MKYNELTELEADIFMPEMHFRQPGFTYSASRPFSKIKEGIQIFKERRYSKYIYKNELDKACIHHDMFHGDFNDLPRLIIAYKLLAQKIRNMTNIKEDLLQCLINFLINNF